MVQNPLVSSVGQEPTHCSTQVPAPFAPENANSLMQTNTQSPVASSRTRAKAKCFLCPAVLSRPDALARHLREMHNDGPPDFACPHKGCKWSEPGKGFPRLDKLQRHLKACKFNNRLRHQKLAGPVTSPSPVERGWSPGGLSPHSAAGLISITYELENEKMRLKALDQACEKSRRAIAHLSAVREFLEVKQAAPSPLLSDGGVAFADSSI